MKLPLRDKNIVLAVTGSIAAYKACEWVRRLKDRGANVRVLMSQSATRFVTPLTFETLSGHPVSITLWGDQPDEAPRQGTQHIDLARWADLFVIAPASANIIGKLAHGLADDLISTECLAFTGPLLIAPAMNPSMYDHPAVQSNIEILKARGVQFLEPEVGETACGEVGAGRLLDTDLALQWIEKAACPAELRGRLLITLGPTQSALDPVRYLTNRSSGRMGYWLARAAANLGFEVRVVAGPVHLPPLPQAQWHSVQTAREMFDVVQKFWPDSDYFIGAAAVLDWDIAGGASAEKIKKSSVSNAGPELRFEANPDILAWVGKNKQSHQRVLGFAAETSDFQKNATQKLQTKACDALFVNPVGRRDSGFDTDTNSGWLISASHEVEFSSMTKELLAYCILKQFFEWNMPLQTESRPHESSPSVH